jgi:hypothetical protein
MAGTLARHEPAYLTGIAEKLTVPSIEDIEASENISHNHALLRHQCRRLSDASTFHQTVRENQILRPEFPTVVGSRLSRDPLIECLRASYAN